MDKDILAKLHFIKDYFTKLHIAFVPSLSSGSGGQENGDLSPTRVVYFRATLVVE
jgi:hypothetical protein